MKFTLGLLFVALSFVLMMPAAKLTASGKVGPIWLVGLFFLRREPRWVWLFIITISLRTIFLSTMENPETRYVLELFPLVEAVAAIGIVSICEKK